jgi:ankyrin repeat protein
MNSNTDAVRVLIERGAAPVNSTNELGTPLHKAAWGGKLAIVQMLLAHRADVNAIEAPTMETPIFDAAKNGHAPVLRCLIEHGARVDLANREHCSVLRTANVAHHVACVAALFAAGADAHRVDQRCIEWARPYTTGVALHARSSHAAAVVQGALLVCGGDLGAVVSPD